MRPRYTDDDKRRVLDHLADHHFDVACTANEFRLPTATIYRWMNAANVTKPVHSQLQQQQQQHFSESSSSPPPQAMEGLGEGVSSLSPETTEAFKTLHDKLFNIASALSNRIEEAIDEAPLNQRVNALVQLISSISKLAAMLPAEEIEYVYEYENENHVEKTEDLEEDNDAETEDQPASPTYQSEESAG